MLARIASPEWVKLRDRALKAGPLPVGADLPDIDGPLGRPHRQGSALTGRQGADRTCGREAEGRGGVARSSGGMGLCDPIGDPKHLVVRNGRDSAGTVAQMRYAHYIPSREGLRWKQTMVRNGAEIVQLPQNQSTYR